MPANESFLKHLNVHKTPHVVVTAEDEDFDVVILKNLKSEGFNVQYVAMGDDTSAKYSERLHGVANRMAGLNEYYAIVGMVSHGYHCSPFGLIHLSIRRCRKCDTGLTLQDHTEIDCIDSVLPICNTRPRENLVSYGGNSPNAPGWR